MARSSDRQVWLLVPLPLRVLLTPLVLLFAVALDLLVLVTEIPTHLRARFAVSLAVALLMLWVFPTPDTRWVNFDWSAGTSTLGAESVPVHVACIEIHANAASAIGAMLHSAGLLAGSTLLLLHLAVSFLLDLFLAFPALCTCTFICGHVVLVACS